MTNVQKYHDQIESFIKKGYTVAVNRFNNKPVSCVDIPCEKCLFVYRTCIKGFLFWLFEDAKEE